MSVCGTACTTWINYSMTDLVDFSPKIEKIQITLGGRSLHFLHDIWDIIRFHFLGDLRFHFLGDLSKNSSQHCAHFQGYRGYKVIYGQFLKNEACLETGPTLVFIYQGVSYIRMSMGSNVTHFKITWLHLKYLTFFSLAILQDPSECYQM